MHRLESARIRPVRESLLHPNKAQSTALEVSAAGSKQLVSKDVLGRPHLTQIGIEMGCRASHLETPHLFEDAKTHRND